MAGFRRLSIALVICVLTLSLSIETWAQTPKRIREHEVQREETVYSIARRYNASIEKIYELNPWAKKQIKVGDKLLIPADSSAQQTSRSTPTKTTRHKVEAGETLYRISKIYGVELADLLRANPGVTTSSLKVGMELLIPISKAEVTPTAPKAKEPEEPSSPTNQVATAQTRVLMLLPLTKDRKFIEFYEGFLLGMYDLKKSGISIQLTTLDIPSDNTLLSYISSGKFVDQDIVIGGVNDVQIRAIAEASGYNHYIVPFSRIDNLTPHSGNVILANAQSSYIIERVVPFFLQRYKGREVVFTRRRTDTEEPFVTQLRPALQKAGITMRTIEVGSGSMPSIGSNTVVVPISADRNLALATVAAIGTQSTGVTLFGYPQWQSYGGQFQQSLHRLNTTIYSSFFFDPTMPEAKDFLTQYNTWFGHKISNTYPKYSVLGYDIARYFIRAYAAHGKGFISSSSTLPHDGLQLDFQLQPHGSRVYSNTRFYLVTYTSSGSILRESF